MPAQCSCKDNRCAKVDLAPLEIWPCWIKGGKKGGEKGRENYSFSGFHTQFEIPCLLSEMLFLCLLKRYENSFYSHVGCWKCININGFVNLSVSSTSAKCLVLILWLLHFYRSMFLEIIPFLVYMTVRTKCVSDCLWKWEYCQQYAVNFIIMWKSIVRYAWIAIKAAWFLTPSWMLLQDVHASFPKKCAGNAKVKVWPPFWVQFLI